MFYVEKELRQYHELSEDDQRIVIGEFFNSHNDYVFLSDIVSDALDEKTKWLEDVCGFYDVEFQWVHDNNNHIYVRFATNGLNFRVFLDVFPSEQISSNFMVYYNETDVNLLIDVLDKGGYKYSDIKIKLPYLAPDEMCKEVRDHINKNYISICRDIDVKLNELLDWFESDDRAIEILSDMYLFDEDLNFYLMDNTNYYEKKINLSYPKLEEIYLNDERS